jgi:integrase
MLSLRRNEVANLRWDDRNTKNNTITVFGKGQKLKYIPLPAHSIALLTEFQRLKSQASLESAYILSPLQNHSTDDLMKPITPSYIFKIVQKITKLLQETGKIDP